MEFDIRRALPGDYQEICRLCEVVDTLHRRHLPHIFRTPQGPAREWSFVRHLLESRDIGFFVAELDGELAGFVTVMLENAADIPLFVPRKYGVVDNLVVDERFRRRGLGRALMAKAEAWALAMDATEVTLNVYEFNQGAQDMYRALGYHTISRKMAKRFSGTM